MQRELYYKWPYWAAPDDEGCVLQEKEERGVAGVEAPWQGPARQPAQGAGQPLIRQSKNLK